MTKYVVLGKLWTTRLNGIVLKISFFLGLIELYSKDLNPIVTSLTSSINVFVTNINIS